MLPNVGGRKAIRISTARLFDRSALRESLMKSEMRSAALIYGSVATVTVLLLNGVVEPRSVARDVARIRQRRLFSHQFRANVADGL